jgi:hypothetical protein
MGWIRLHSPGQAFFDNGLGFLTGLVISPLAVDPARAGDQIPDVWAMGARNWACGRELGDLLRVHRDAAGLTTPPNSRSSCTSAPCGWRSATTESWPSNCSPCCSRIVTD